MILKRAMCLSLLLGALGFSAHSFAVDPEAAQALAKKEGCLKCHAMDKKKEASSLRDIAKKFSGKPNAETKIMEQITTGPKIKMDGSEQEHKIVKTKDQAELSNMIAWILTLK